MITDDAQLQQALEQMARLYCSLASLRQELHPASPRNFAILAEGTVDHILRLRTEIDEYTGLAPAPARHRRSPAEGTRAARLNAERRT